MTPTSMMVAVVDGMFGSDELFHLQRAARMSNAGCCVAAHCRSSADLSWDHFNVKR